MSCPVRCSLDARQSVVEAVLKRKGEFEMVRHLPIIRDNESCDEYYARCKGGFFAKLRTFAGKLFNRQ